MADTPDDLVARLEEFEANVWIHTDDAFQQQFDTATDASDDVTSLTELMDRVEIPIERWYRTAVSERTRSF